MRASTHLCSGLQLLQAEGRSKSSPPCTSRRRHVSSTRGEQCLLQQSVISHANGVSDYPQNLQNNDSAPLLCATGPLVSGATQLSTSTVGKNDICVGPELARRLFYMEWPADSEASASL
jgi:hypothetical protein